MKKTTTSAASPVDAITVTVSRLGSAATVVTLPKGDGATVQAALEAASVSTSGRGEYFVSGERAELNDILDDKDILIIVTPKQAGSK